MNIEHPFTLNRAQAVAEAERLVAQVRSRCAALGVSPVEFGELLLPEALLAMMVGGMSQEEVQQSFERFVREEVPAWYLQVKRHAGACDCAREAGAEHAPGCASVRLSARVQNRMRAQDGLA